MSQFEKHLTDQVSEEGPVIDKSRDDAVIWKVTLRLIPFIFLLYVVNILDRVNVGFARLKMLEDLHMSEQVYGLGAGIFFIGYFLFEVPSNLIMRRTGARLWMARIMITWGLISSAMMFVTEPQSFYLLRFLLGVAEAGFFPGMILYLTYWFPARERSRAVSRFMTASPIAGMLGNPISGALLQYMDQVAGLRGWQWLFLIEGIPAMLLGVTVLFYLTDRPEHAAWLTPAERTWLVERMSGEERHREQRHGLTLLKAMAYPRVWLLSALYFTLAMPSNTFGMYLPKLIEGHFADRGKFQIGLLAAVPSIVAAISMVLNGVHSDRTGERRWHVAVPAFVAATGWTMTALVPSPGLVLLALCLTQLGMMSMLGPFWALPTSFLSGAAAAGGIALINSLGNLGGFVGPYIFGKVKTATDSFSGAMLAMSLALFIGGILALSVRHDSAWERAAPHD
ncbi:MAG: MFS transporter [Planctomycetes bacterium]|nr:MFS transporter [Planctomycetota bacterium]